MAFGNDDSTLQFATVFIMFLLWFLTLIPVRIAQSRMQDGLDNANPRDQYRKLPAWGQRAVAVTNNTFEAFCFFSVAVFTHAFSGPRSMSVVHAVDAFCILFIVIRVIYPFFYYYNLPTLRSSVWSTGMLCIFAIFLLAFI